MDAKSESNQTHFFLNSVESSPIPPTTAVAISSPSNLQEKSSPSSENEITSFLSHLRSDGYRENIFEKLIQRRKSKQDEIRVCQEEIQVIDDILQFINQYQTKHSPEQLTYHQTKNPPKEDSPFNVFDTNCDLNLFNSPLVGVVDDFSLQTSSKDDPIIDPLASLFSPSSTSFNLPSPMTPFTNLSSNNDLIQDINYLPATTISSNHEHFTHNPFS